MKNLVLTLTLVVIASFSNAQSTYYDVYSYNETSDDKRTWAKVEITVTENKINICHYGSLNGVPIPHVYDIVSGPSNYINGGIRYRVKLRPLENTVYTLIVEKDKISFMTDDYGIKEYYYYSAKDIINSFK